MVKLRHFAMAVPDMQGTARFYEQSFGMQRVREAPHALLLSDGVISLAILDNTKSAEAMGRNGLHHFGVVADDVAMTSKLVEQNGAVYCDEEKNLQARMNMRGDAQGSNVLAHAQQQEQRKYKDPNGIDFDIANAAHARNVWKIPA